MYKLEQEVYGLHEGNTPENFDAKEITSKHKSSNHKEYRLDTEDYIK